MNPKQLLRPYDNYLRVTGKQEVIPRLGLPTIRQNASVAHRSEIAHRRMVVGWEILRNHGRNNNSPGTDKLSLRQTFSCTRVARQLSLETRPIGRGKRPGMRVGCREFALGVVLAL